MTAQAVKSFGVAITHRVFVVVAQPLVFVQLFKLGFASVVVHLVGKVRRKDKRFIPDNADREGQGKLVALDADEDAPLVDVAFDVIGDGTLGSDVSCEGITMRSLY